MIRPKIPQPLLPAFWRKLYHLLVNAGVTDNNHQQNKRIRVINISSLIAASLVFFFGGGLTILSGKTAMLYPAIPETALFVFVIWLNFKQRYFYSALFWHFTFCSATLVFGIMLSTVIDATHMAAYLFGAPLLIFKRKESRLLAACLVCSSIALIGIELNTHLKVFTPLPITSSLYPVFRIATWFTVILLNVIVILFYLQQNNILIGKLQQSNAKLNRVNKKLAKASYYKTIYVNETTHELRSPLNALYAISHLLQDDSINEIDRQKMYASMGYTVDHAIEIINNVLELAKVESGKKISIHYENLHIRNWMEDVLGIYSYQASNKKITIKANFGREVPIEIGMARLQVNQVLNNLLSNAIKFATEGTIIQVSVGVEGEKWYFSVRDQGMGMSPATLENIFIPFFTAGANNPTGTGLGMHIAKKITERLGGDLKAESQLGEGSEFTAYFPMVIANSGNSSDPIPTTSLVIRAQVLIIDDDAIGTQYCSKVLAGMGCSVTVAHTGLAGLREAELNRPDLVLMDISLPDINGKDLLQKFKGNSKLCTIPVVFVTGSSLTADKEAAIQLGAEEYLVKPLMVDTFNRLLGKYSF